MTPSPFLDPDIVRSLYELPDRLGRRTSALHQAKTHGRDVAVVIPTLLQQAHARYELILDIGCGRGTTTLRPLSDPSEFPRTQKIFATADVSA